MASDEEIWKLILKTEGEDKLAALVARMRQAEQALKDNIAKFGATSPVVAANATALANMSEKAKALEKDLAKVGGSSRNMGYAVQVGAQAVEDLQYGFDAIVNNIPQVVSALGGPAGIVGGISLLAIGINQLIRHWDDLMGAFGAGKIKTQADLIEELGKVVHKTADEMARLADMERRRDEAKAQRGIPNPGEQEQREGVHGALGERRRDDNLDAARRLLGDRFAKAVPGRLLDDAAKADDQLQARRKNGKAEDPNADPGAGLEAQEQKAKRAGQAVTDWINEQVEAFMADLASPAGRDKLKQYIDQLKKERKDRADAGADPDELNQRDKQIRGLGEALKTPAERRAEAQKARDNEQAQDKLDSLDEDRQKEKDSNEYYEQQERDNASRKAQADEQSRKQLESQLAGQLGGGVLGKRAAAGTLGGFEVEDALSKMGLDLDQIDSVRDGVKGHLQAHGDDEARARAAADGVDIDTARFRIGRDADRDTAKQFKDAQGGVAEAWQAIGTPQESHRMSQVIDTAGLSDSIQAAVGGDHDVPKQQLDQLQKANENLQKLVEKVGNNAPVLRR